MHRVEIFLLAKPHRAARQSEQNLSGVESDRDAGFVRYEPTLKAALGN